MRNESSNFFYSALLIIGGLFAIFNIRIGIRNLRNQNKNKDYLTLLRENKALRERNQELEKLIL